jgi:hypothetical protein
VVSRQQKADQYKSAGKTANDHFHFHKEWIPMDEKCEPGVGDKIANSALA